MNEQAGCALTIDTDGRTWWSSKRGQVNGSNRLQLSFDEKKGRGVFATRELRKSTVAFHNKALSSVVVNGAETDVCSLCWRALGDQVRGPPSWTSLRYCSLTCKEQDRDFLRACGETILSIAKRRSEDYDAQVLALKYLYRLSVETDAEECSSLLAIMGLAQHSSSESAKDCADLLLFTAIQKESPQLLERIRRWMPFDRELCRSLLAIVRLNAQPVRLYGAGNVSILCLLPTVARLNHSCKPNCELMARVDGVWPAAQLTISVLATATLQPGDELLISYLGVLHESCTTRRQLLQQGFHFTCHCQRCEAEAGECNEEAADLDRLFGARAPPLPLEECEGIVRRCEELCLSRSPRAQPSALPGVCNALLLVIADYPSRFQKFNDNESLYLRFAVVFFRAGRMLVDFSAHYSPHGLMRVQLMTAICLYATLAAKRLSLRVASVAPPPGVREVVLEALSTCVDAQTILDRVYFTEESGTSWREDGIPAGVLDSWMYASQLRRRLATLQGSLQKARLLFPDT